MSDIDVLANSHLIQSFVWEGVNFSLNEREKKILKRCEARIEWIEKKCSKYKSHPHFGLKYLKHKLSEQNHV